MKKRYLLLLSFVFSLLLVCLNHAEIIDRYLFLWTILGLIATIVFTFLIGYFAGRNDYTKRIMLFCNLNLLNLILIPIIFGTLENFGSQRVATSVEDYTTQHQCYPTTLNEATTVWLLIPNTYYYTKIRCDSAELTCFNLQKKYDFEGKTWNIRATSGGNYHSLWLMGH